MKKSTPFTSKHTPGPYFVQSRARKRASGYSHLRPLADKVSIHAGPDLLATKVCDVERARDAGLLAAAPDLLAALKELVARCDGEEGVGADGSNIQTIAAHAAIKKAEGE